MTAKRRKFVEHYLRTGNATESAKAAGFSERTAYSMGNFLLKNIEVQNEIQSFQRDMTTATKLKVHEIVADVLRIGRADIRKVFDENGRLKPIHQLDDDTAFAISEYTETTYKDTTVKKVRLYSKQTAQDMLLKVTGGYVTEFSLLQKMDLEDLEALVEKVMSKLNTYELQLKKA